MNKTNLEHALYALLMQLPFLLFGYPWTGAAFAIAWFISREHSERETQVARITGRLKKELKPWDGFTGWDADRRLDVIIPAAVCIIIAILI